MKKKAIIISLVIVFLFAVTGCGRSQDEIDAQLKDATESFDLIVSNNVENTIYHNEGEHFGLLLKDGDKLEWSADTSISQKDILFSFNVAPFITAGLDPSQLSGDVFEYIEATDTAGGMLEYSYDAGSVKKQNSDSIDAFNNLLAQMPDQLEALNQDGYILNIGNGFQVHWNGEQRENKDIALIINADELIAAGLVVDKLDGWKLLTNNADDDNSIYLVKVYYLK